MKVLDLFSGLGGWSQAFLDRGHDVYRIDNDIQFDNVPATIIGDVMNFSWGNSWRDQGGHYDVVLASPPCQAFSLAAIRTHMTAWRQCGTCNGHCMRTTDLKWVCNHCSPGNPVGPVQLIPRTDFAKTSVKLVDKTLEHIRNIQPKFWWMENPNGAMIHFVPTDIPRVQVTYCQYGLPMMKLTNLWGNWPDTWMPRPRCVNGMPCHEAAPRGATTGLQGVRGKDGKALRSKVPYELSMEVCRAAEAAI